MKKVLMMLAIAASVMVVSCGKGDGKNAGGDSAATEQAEVAYPLELNCDLGSTSGDFSTLAPALGVAKYVLSEPVGDQVPVEATVTLVVKHPDASIKEMQSYKVMLGYRTEADESKETTYLDADPAEGEKMVKLVTEGKEGDKGVFKFTGKITKEEAEGLKAAKSYYMFNKDVVWGK